MENCTGNWVISRNHWEIGEIWGKLGENWGIVFPQSISPTSGKEGENEGKLLHKNSHLENLCETGGGNEREFVFFTTSFNCTVLFVCIKSPNI